MTKIEQAMLQYMECGLKLRCSTQNVVCERNCRIIQIRTSYTEVHGMWPVKEIVE